MKIVTNHYGYSYDEDDNSYVVSYIEDRHPLYEVAHKKKQSDAIEECKRLERLYEE